VAQARDSLGRFTGGGGVSGPVIAQLEANASDADEILDAIGEDIVAEQKAAIDRGLKPALSPAYAKRKAAAGHGGDPILVWTRETYDSIDVERGPDWVSAGTENERMAFAASLEPRSVQPFRDPISIDEDVWGPRIEDRILGGLFRGIDVEVSQVAA
jgi:hypothetical protein